MTPFSATRVAPRLYALGFNRELVSTLLTQVDTWIKCSGEEWTVSRLKSLKNWYIRWRYDSKNPPPWISVHKDGRPRGIFGRVFLLGKHDKLPMSKILCALQVYKAYRAKSPTRDQLKKFYDSVLTEERASDVEIRLDATKNGLKRLTKNLDLSIQKFHFVDQFRPGHKLTSEFRVIDSLIGWLSSGSKRAPSVISYWPKDWFKEINGGRKWKSCSMLESEIDPTQHLELASYPEMLLNPSYLFLIRAYFPDLVEDSDGNLRYHFSRKVLGHENDLIRKDVPFHVGRIAYIQEPGYKLRAVANPNRVFQLLLSRLGKACFSILKSVDQDFTFHQDAGVELVQEWISEKRTVYCFDLSDATNNFPLKWQLRLLEEILPGQFLPEIDLFGKVSRAPWITPEGNTIAWKRGQPMGLYPSFASFALTHHALARDCFKQSGSRGDPRLYDYAIIGDDIAIADENAANLYYKICRSCEIPISSSKTIISSEVASFGGKVINKFGSHQGHNYVPCKDDSFMDILRQLGKGFLPFLRPLQKQIARILAPKPFPIGLGWNPEGIPLEERLTELEFEAFLKNRGPIPFAKDYCSRDPIVTKMENRSLKFGAISDLRFTKYGTSSATVPCTHPDQGLVESVSPLLAKLDEYGIPVGGNLSAIEFQNLLTFRRTPSVAPKKGVLDRLFPRSFKQRLSEKYGVNLASYIPGSKGFLAGQILTFPGRFRPKGDGKSGLSLKKWLKSLKREIKSLR